MSIVITHHGADWKTPHWRVHREGCQDIPTYAERFSSEATTLEALTIEEYSCQIEENECDWREYSGEFRIMPCAKDLIKDH